MRYFSMFSGIGGFELGIYQAYVEMLNRSKNGKIKGNTAKNAKAGSGLVAAQGEGAGSKAGRICQLSDGSDDAGAPACVGYSEIDAHAIRIYSKHFVHTNYGDATKIIPRQLPDFDFLCGGFPCQAFSIAGLRRGFNDTRGTLFFDIARILREKQPRLLLLENVKGLLSHDHGRTFKTIIAALAELGYDLQWQVLNSKDFGVPQNRERVFIVGHPGETPGPQVFPLAGNDGAGDEESLRPPQNASTLQAGYGRAHGGDTYIREEITKIRRLTPLECERLQGFPDGWTEGASDTQRYKCLGNAVTVNVVREIVKRIFYAD